jgi:hypothetical protein
MVIDCLYNIFSGTNNGCSEEWIERRSSRDQSSASQSSTGIDLLFVDDRNQLWVIMTFSSVCPSVLPLHYHVHKYVTKPIIYWYTSYYGQQRRVRGALAATSRISTTLHLLPAPPTTHVPPVLRQLPFSQVCDLRLCRRKAFGRQTSLPPAKGEQVIKESSTPTLEGQREQLASCHNTPNSTALEEGKIVKSKFSYLVFTPLHLFT